MSSEDGALGITPLQGAVNDASARASIAWLTFLTFAVYLAITVGSVTHRMLFLGGSVNLPVLKVDLPLLGFFAVAPLLFLVLHFYLLIQLVILRQKVLSFEEVLWRTTRVRSDRVLIRQGLNAFPITQLMAGPGRETPNFVTGLLSIVAFITLLLAPLAVLLQVQFVFLPYHDASISWLHRAAIIIDLLIVWALWFATRNRREVDATSRPTKRRLIYPAVMLFVAGVASGAVVFIVMVVATFPGEAIYNGKLQEYLSSKRVIGGEADEIAGAPKSLLSNVIVLPGQTFVEDEKLRKQGHSVSLRGRDLRGAVLMRSDLRQADFSGANLNGANLYRAKLQGASLSCIETSSAGRQPGRDVVIELGDPVPLRWPFDGCTWMQGANLQEAELQGTSLDGAKLQGANLALGKLQGASLRAAWLDAASLLGTELHGASLDGARFHGAALNGARLQGATIDKAEFDGASFGFTFVLLGRSECTRGCRSMLWPKTSVWRMTGLPASIGFATFEMIDSTTQPFESKPFQRWREEILNAIVDDTSRERVRERLSALDPEAAEPSNPIPPDIWKQLEADTVLGPETEGPIAEFLLDLACAPENAPHVARGLIRNDRFGAAGLLLPEVIKMLDADQCPGAMGLTRKDFEDLQRLAERRKREITGRPEDDPPDEKYDR
jgi:uncharacterized protein YjbI with pentapeptide repeats